MSFRRPLTHAENEFLLWLLPEEKEGYRIHREFAMRSNVIGEGRWGSGDLMLAQKEDAIDVTLGMSHVVAYGECEIDSTTLTISIHEPNIDDQMEVQFSGVYPLPESPVVTNGWTYSYWKPGSPCPATGQQVKEISVADLDSTIYTIAISSEKKTMWLHHHRSGWNQLLPVTGFYDELLRTKGIRDAKLVLNPKTFFERLNDFSESDYRLALVEYNNRIGNKIAGLEGVNVMPVPKRKSFMARILDKSKESL